MYKTYPCSRCGEEVYDQLTHKCPSETNYIDWEQRRWDAVIALVKKHWGTVHAIEEADALIKAYRAAGEAK